MKLSSLARSIELAKLAAQVGMKEFRSGGLKSRLEQATLIANSLSQLKGAAMKAGQLLSLDLDNYFPPEAIEILSKLQSAATAHPFEEILATLSKEFGPEKFLRLESISKNPIGVASIGQVHRASFDGRQIVLKIQYPGVADSIDSDLKILKTLAVSFCAVSGRRMDLDPLFKEFRTVLAQEVDYVREAQFQKQYQAQIAKMQSGSAVKFSVPNVVDELSNPRVLAMSFASGQALRTWISSGPSPAKKQQIARAVLDLYFQEFFDWGLVQTDPNWGNFLIEDSAQSLNLTVLDFGACKQYPREFIQNYVQLLTLASQKNSKMIRDHAIAFGLIDPRESPAAFAAFEEILSTAIRPFFMKAENSQYFDFAQKEHIVDSQNAAKSLAEKLVYSPPPYALVFLHRKLAGVYSILKHLEVRMDISTYWEKMQDLSNKGA